MQTNSIAIRIRASLILFIATISTGCMHWPDAPFTDAAPSLDSRSNLQLRATYPEAKVNAPVYRTHMELQPNAYAVVSQTFLFTDADNNTYRGESTSESLSIRPAMFIDELPERHRQSFFEGSSAVVKGDYVIHRIWQFAVSEPDSQPDSQLRKKGSRLESSEAMSYEFEFESGGRRGLGLIHPDGVSRSVRFLVDESDR